ncbi:MAG: M1 family peptidase, partial [Chryseobacterium sp.]
GLNILRETIMGRELFDYAFKEYSRRWAFKHPEPADLFRTMEDASGEDLDWFWRGWFYGTDPCDIALDSVKFAKADFPKDVPAARSRMVKVDKPALNAFDDISKIRNREDKKISFYVDKNTAAQDFYYKYDRGLVTVDTTKTTKTEMSMPYEVVPETDQGKYANKFLYELSFSNRGGLVMPIIVEFTYKDGTKEIDRIPAQIWRHNELKTSKFYVKDKEVESILVDPLRETADIDTSNNGWGGKAKESKFKVYKMKMASAVRGQSVGSNPMKVAGSK